METTQISINEFSNYLVNLFSSKGDFLTNKKLQKLLYYIQAWHLVHFEGKNIYTKNSTPQAWRHGPVYTEVYKNYKKHGFNGIEPTDNSFKGVATQLASFELAPEQNDYLTAAINYYGKKNAFELEMLSHNEAPWLQARKGLDDFDRGNVYISLPLMQEYYSNLLNE